MIEVYLKKNHLFICLYGIRAIKGIADENLG
jgi:hypothetical protein